MHESGTDSCVDVLCSNYLIKVTITYFYKGNFILDSNDLLYSKVVRGLSAVL